MAWKKLSSKQVYQNRFMTVTEEELLTDFGERVQFGIVHKEPAIMIIPWDGEHFTLIGQYRYPVDQFSWEFPAGHMEHASIKMAAKEELEEETGLKATDLKEIGHFHIAAGHLTQVCHIFLATGLSKGTRKLEPAEADMQIKKVTHLELNKMIKQGLVTDSLTITSLKLYELQLSTT